MQIICTYQADPAIASGEPSSQGGALASMFVKFQWVLAEKGHGPESLDHSRPEEQCLSCLVDIDAATGSVVETLLAQSSAQVQLISSGSSMPNPHAMT